MISFFRRARDPFFGDSDRLRGLLDGDEPFFLVDVRSRQEYARGHIRGAEHVPYEQIAERPPTDDRSALIVLYCHKGARSETARRALQDAGYERVHNFGGIIHWPDGLVGGTE